MTSIPKIGRIHPSQVRELQSTNLTILGEEFLSGSQVKVGGVFYGAMMLDEGRRLTLTTPLPATLEKGEYPVIVYNADGGISNQATLEVFGAKSQRDGYAKKIVDQREQPLPVPLNGRSDTQRIAAGNQFDGTLPDQDLGVFGDGNGATKGGVWVYNDDIVLTQVDFHAAAVEAVARGNASGLYVVRKGQTKAQAQFLFSVGGADGQRENLSLRGEEINVDKGEMLFFLTAGATQEMTVTLHVKRRNQR